MKKLKNFLKASADNTETTTNIVLGGGAIPS